MQVVTTHTCDENEMQIDETTNMRSIDEITKKELYDLHLYFTEIVTNESREICLKKITGSHTNIKQYTKY